jgi:XapX domain-containing protein
VIYSQSHVRSPAPPLIALVGLPGILAGEQVLPLGKQLMRGDHLPIAQRTELLLQPQQFRPRRITSHSPGGCSCVERADGPEKRCEAAPIYDLSERLFQRRDGVAANVSHVLQFLCENHISHSVLSGLGTRTKRGTND